MYAVIIYSDRNDHAAERLAGELSAFDGLTVMVAGAEQIRPLPESALHIKTEFSGEGAAIKSAIRYAQAALPECSVIATVTNAARHKADEIVRICEIAASNPKTLVLGAAEGLRRLRGAIDKALFRLASGQSVGDITASLRAFSVEIAERFAQIATDGDGFEIDMLLEASRAGLRIDEVRVSVEDAALKKINWRKMLGIYRCAALFLGSSLFAFGLEFLLLVGIRRLCAPFGAEAALSIAVALSRVISCIVNYAMNKKMVFKSKTSLGGSLVRYFIVAGVVLVINYLLLRTFVIVVGWPLWISKLCVESALFFLNFALQGKIVYKE